MTDCEQPWCCSFTHESPLYICLIWKEQRGSTARDQSELSPPVFSVICVSCTYISLSGFMTENGQCRFRFFFLFHSVTYEQCATCTLPTVPFCWWEWAECIGLSLSFMCLYHPFSHALFIYCSRPAKWVEIHMDQLVADTDLRWEKQSPGPGPGPNQKEHFEEEEDLVISTVITCHRLPSLQSLYPPLRPAS